MTPPWLSTSQVASLQITCNASAIQILVSQKMSGEDFKWIAQMKGTPVPGTTTSEPRYYYRCADDLKTQRIWRLRIKFLFGVPGAQVVTLQSLSLSFASNIVVRRGSGKVSSEVEKGEGRVRMWS
jgi:hypothetical protein